MADRRSHRTTTGLQGHTAGTFRIRSLRIRTRSTRADTRAGAHVD